MGERDQAHGGFVPPVELAGLSPRSRQVLFAIVKHHIRSGQAAGSSAVAQVLRSEWSSATIRYEMAALEERGFIAKLHVSAGRIPTSLGYELFVSDLLARLRHRSVRADLSLAADLHGELAVRLRAMSVALAERTCLVGMVLFGGVARSVLEHLQFLCLGPRRLVAVLATRAGSVVHKPLEIETDIHSNEVERLNAYVSEHYRGLALQEVRDRLRAEVEGQGAAALTLSRQALRLAQMALDASGDDREVYIEGRGRLLEREEFAQVERLRALIAALEEKELWLQVVDASLSQPGLMVHLGEGRLPAGTQECALITAPFDLESGVSGRVGVLGPLRMDYERLLPIVQAASLALGA